VLAYFGCGLFHPTKSAKANLVDMKLTASLRLCSMGTIFTSKGVVVLFCFCFCGQHVHVLQPSVNML